MWETTNPYPLPKRCGKEWRFLSNIEEYNGRARSVAERFGVAVWDTYSVLKHVFDRNYDQTGHYRFPEALWPSLVDSLLAKETGRGNATSGKVLASRVVRR